MWNKSIKLPKEIVEVVDDDGFGGSEEVTFLEGIPANFKDLSRNAVVLANQSGNNATIEVEIMACNYDNQGYLIDEATGIRYDIKRAFRKDKGNTISFDCEVRERGSI